MATVTYDKDATTLLAIDRYNVSSPRAASSRTRCLTSVSRTTPVPSGPQIVDSLSSVQDWESVRSSVAM